MQRIFFDHKWLRDYITEDDISAYSADVKRANKTLMKREGVGKNSLGWLELPRKYSESELDSIILKTAEFREKADFLLCIGVGGSYLGARAGMEFLGPGIDELKDKRVLFAGRNFNSDSLWDILDFLKDKEVAVNVISKSGGTAEPGVAFRIVRVWMERKYGKKEAAERIVATTAKASGSLQRLAETEGYATFAIPGDVGGRFSVLTPVGLFPFAFAGIDIKKVMIGADTALSMCEKNSVEDNVAMQYAVIRNICFARGKAVECLALFQPHLHHLGEWWKQLAGESEGKRYTGIFPSVLDYTADLHSLGQWMQEGMRNVFETFIFLKKTERRLEIPALQDDADGFDYLAGKTLEDINLQALRGTILAHVDAGVPVATLTLTDRSEETLGQFFYFFQRALALSGYLMRVNPFDQPGVEAYKKNMFALLGKPGYEEHRRTIEEKLA